MTAAPDFLFVLEHVARSPVARAVARTRLRQAMADFQTRLYMLHDGEVVPIDCQAAAKALAVAAATLDVQGLGDSVEARIIAGGMGAISDIARTRWVWRQRHAAAIDTALEHAKEVYTHAKAEEVNAAHRMVARVEAGVMAPDAKLSGPNGPQEKQR